MRALVTGAAGFIGSHLSEKLVKMGYRVIGLDSFTPYYPRKFKEENIAELRNQSSFDFVEKDILEADLASLVQSVDFVFHLAAQPGVRTSWLKFDEYARHNLVVTQRLLEACRKPFIRRFVFASSSSVYGEAGSRPTTEQVPPKPVSPYGITKAAAERLCEVYAMYYGIPIVMLRYFTVYGPRQRPDMAIYRFIESILLDKEVTLYGDGSQSRDFTYVSDIVEGTIRTADSDLKLEGEILNLGRGKPVTVSEVVAMISSDLSRKPSLRFEPGKEGDVSETFADIAKARRFLSYDPAVNMSEGLKFQIQWQRNRYAAKT